MCNESRMKKTRFLGLSLLTLALAGCGDDPGIDVLSERISAYDEENPCNTNAVKLTITRPGEEPEVEYVCQGVDDPLVPELDAVMESMIGLQSFEVEYACACDPEVTQEECELYELEMSVITRQQRVCANESLILLGEPPPPSAMELIECLGEFAAAAEECFALADLEVCSPDDESEIEACMTEISFYDECFDEADKEAIYWLELLMDIGQEFYDCEVFFFLF